MRYMVWLCILVRYRAFFLRWFVFLTAATIGFVYGAFQAYARAFYAELIPKGEEAKWYALFSITDKVREFCCCPHLERNLTRISVLFVCWAFGRRSNRRPNG